MSTTLTIRNLDEQVKRLLRIRAASHGRAMEAEAREILTRAVMETSAPTASPPGKASRKVPSVCDSVRGIWKGRTSTDEIMKLTRGE